MSDGLAPSVPRYTMLVNEDSLRWQHYRDDLLDFWRQRGIAPEIHIVDWRDAIPCDGQIRSLLSPEPSVFRIGSPARGFDIVRQLLQAGQRARNESESDWSAPHPGWLASPALVHDGLSHVLNGIERAVSQHGWLHPAPPNDLFRDIRLAFDKNATAELLETTGVPVPAWFRPTGSGISLLSELVSRRWPAAYVKLAASSSAQGIVVLRRSRDAWQAITTMIEVDENFHNTRRLARPQGASLLRVLDFLIQEGATVQRGIRKSEVGGENFDVRVVVDRGVVAGTIFRSSRRPITNLHLGGRRADATACRQQIGTRRWLDAMDDCLRVADLFTIPTIGIDLMFDRADSRHYIIEVNAFGDFFPGWLNDQGRTIHQVEIESTARIYFI